LQPGKSESLLLQLPWKSSSIGPTTLPEQELVAVLKSNGPTFIFTESDSYSLDVPAIYPVVCNFFF